MSTPDVDGNRGSLSESERLQFLSALTEVLARAESLGDGCRNAIRVACEWLHAEQGAIDFVSAGAPGEPDVIVPGYAWPERADMRVDLNQPPFSAQAVRNPDLTWRYGTPAAQSPNHADISQTAIVTLPLQSRNPGQGQQGERKVNGVWVLILPVNQGAGIDTCTQDVLRIAARQVGIFIDDVGVRRRSQEEIGISLAREHELNELKTRFITTVSHEFRTPLSRILSAAELIERYGERISAEKRRNYVDQIRASITFIADMLQEVLLVGNYEAGVMEVDTRPVDLEQFCAELVQQLQMTIGRRCRLIFDSRGDCISARVDTRILKQILMNLLNNAIRYSPQQDPTVEFTLECEPNRATFRIVDHGIGIPDEDQARIFDAFYRGSNVSLMAGSGLGLAIVKNAVQAHKGEVSFHSVVGEGTTFTVTMPLR